MGRFLVLSAIVLLFASGCTPDSRMGNGDSGGGRSVETTVSSAVQVGIKLTAGMTPAEIQAVVGEVESRDDGQFHEWAFEDGSRLVVEVSEGKATSANVYEGSVQPSVMLF